MVEDPNTQKSTTKEPTTPKPINQGSTKIWLIFNLIILFLLLILIGNLATKQIIHFLSPIGVLLIILIVIGVLTYIFKKSKELTPNAWASLSSIMIILIMTISGLFAPRGINYILILFSMLLFFIVLGILACGRLPGILIDDRNQMSLSRFQIVVWTLIILSAYFTIALSRIAVNAPAPLEIEVDWQIWALLGISTVSLVGSPLILSEKKNKEPTKQEIEIFDGVVGETKMTNVGIIPENNDVKTAAFSDIFKGDETATISNINMAKVQMFFFTIIIAISYAVMLFALIANNDPSEITGFPLLDQGVIAILAISHAGYLTNKTTDQTAVEKST